MDQLLAAARGTMAQVPFCWAITPSDNGGVNVRMMGPIPGVAGEKDWTIWCTTSRSSRKAADIRRAGRLTLGYQHRPDSVPDNYVALIGRAVLVEDRSAIRDRWQEKWQRFFPGGPDDPDVVFVRLNVERIELCVRGVTPEPFGCRHSVLERGADGGWKVVSD